MHIYYYKAIQDDNHYYQAIGYLMIHYYHKAIRYDFNEISINIYALQKMAYIYMN